MGLNKEVAYYSLPDVNGTIGPTAGTASAGFTGYSDGGGMEFEVQSELNTATKGDDDHTAISEVADSGIMCTITVMEGTRFYAELYALAKAQHEFKGLPPCPFFMIDPHNGDEINEKYAVFRQIPGPTKQGEASERVFTIYLPKARRDMILGGALLP